MSIETDAPPAMGSVPYDPPAYDPPADAPPVSGNMQPEPEAAAAPPNTYLGKVQQLYSVDTEDVVQRCLVALNPLLRRPFLTNGLLDAENSNNQPGTIVYGKLPDLWGPTWIYLTMAFSVFFASTTSGLMNNVEGDYNAGLLTGAAGTLFAFIYVVPVLLWLSVQYFNLVPTLTLVQTICLFGYSCTVWIPAVLVAGSPFGARALVGSVIAQLVRGLSIGLAALLSAWFIYGNLYKVIFAHASQSVAVDKTKAMLVLGAGLVVHAALAATVLILISFASQELKAS